MSVTNEPFSSNAIKVTLTMSVTNEPFSSTSKVPVLTPRLISDLRAPNNTSFIVDSDKYMFHTKDRAITLIT